MDRHTVDWTGPLPALTTPFKEDGAIDFAGFAGNIERLLDAGSTGFVVAGCTGEFWALSSEERKALAKAAVRTVSGKVPVIIGAAAIEPEKVIEQSRNGAEAGADAILVMPPYFIQATDAEMLAHFEQVNAGSELPIVLYNIPGNAGNAITPALAGKLADLDKVIAIKESSGDWNNFHRTLLTVKDRIRVFCGPSSVFGVAAAQAGTDGFIDCFPNVWAPGGLDLWYAATDGRDEEADRLQAIGIALTDLFVGDGRTLYPSTKAAMNYMQLDGGGMPRPPLRPLQGSQLHELEAGIDAIFGNMDNGRSGQRSGYGSGA